MYRHLLCATIVCILMSAISNAQVEVRTLGGSAEEYGYNIWPTATGGFYTAGTQETSPGSGEAHFWVVRFDAQAKKVWEKTYGDAGVSETHFGSSETRDGGLMFGGFTGRQFSGNESAIMFRIDTNGNQLWREQIDYKSSDHFHFMVERKEGGYYLGGHTDSKTDANGNVWLLKLDSARNIIWEKEYDNGASEHAHWGIETRDGGALMLGHTDANSNGHEKYWLVKVDSMGAKQWDKVYSSSPSVDDSPYRVFETRDGNYGLVGGSASTTRGQSWLLVVDTLGNILIDKHFGDPASDTFTWSGSQTSDGGYILAGYTTFKAKGAEDMYIVKTHPDGSVDWEQIVGGVNSDVVFDVTETPSAYVAVGETFSPEYMKGGAGDMAIVLISKSTSPAATMLISPPNDSTGTATTVNLRWHGALTATQYALEVAADPNFTSVVKSDSSLTDTIAQVRGLIQEQWYWWRVRAHNAAGWGAYSEVWKFQVGSSSSVAQTGDASAMMSLRAIPNPTSSRTMIHVEFGRSGVVDLRLIDLLGRDVATLIDSELGSHQVNATFDASGLAPGIYVCRAKLTTPDGRVTTRSMRLVIER